MDCSYSAAPVEDAFIPNAQVGQYYLFLVTNYNGQAGYIVYQQTAGTGSSNCNIVCQLEGSNDGPVCPGGSVNLFVTDVPGATFSWTGPNCFTSTQQNPTNVFPPAIPGQYVYFVTANAPNGTICYDTTLVTVLAQGDLSLRGERRSRARVSGFLSRRVVPTDVPLPQSFLSSGSGRGFCVRSIS